MQNMLVMNAEGPETRVAVVEEGALAEFFVERKRDRGMVGNIYRGKGARVTGYISLPARYSVFMPHVAQVCVSKRIGSDKERRRLRDIVNEARPKGTGFIVRTAAEDANDQELRDDVAFLARLRGEIERREEDNKSPGLIYADLDLALRCIRDLLREDTSEVVIDAEEQFERVKKFTMAFLPRFAERVKRYEGRRPIFDHHHIEPALRLAVSRRVPLRS